MAKLNFVKEKFCLKFYFIFLIFCLVLILIETYNCFYIRNGQNLVFAGDEGITELYFDKDENISSVQTTLETIQCDDLLRIASPFSESIIFSNQDKKTFFLYKGEHNIKKLGRYMESKKKNKNMKFQFSQKKPKNFF